MRAIEVPVAIVSILIVARIMTNSNILNLKLGFSSGFYCFRIVRLAVLISPNAITLVRLLRTVL